MKISEFNDFLRLAEEREPVFREVLAAANEIVKEEFQDHISKAETAISHPPSPPSGLSVPQSAASIISGFEHSIEGGDACSGPDLDTLIAYSFRQGAEGQQLTTIVSQYDLWPSTRFDDPNGTDESPRWSPRLQRSQRRPRRHQVLPFYDSGRWQLAVFDMVENKVTCYDTVWTAGTLSSTFLVGQASYIYYGSNADSNRQSLQQWFNATVLSAQEVVFHCYHEKVSHADETCIVY